MNNTEARMRLNMLRNNPTVANNAIAQSVFSAIDSGNNNQLMELFRNVCKEKGLNADEELQRLGIRIN